MRCMRVLGAAVAVVAALTLSACSQDAPEGEGGSSSTTPTAPAAGWDITTLEGVDGASRATVDGIGIDVPADFTSDERTSGEDTTQLVLQREGAARSEVNLTVTRDEDVDDDGVDAAAATAFAQLGASGIASDLQQVPLTWEGFGHAVAVRGVLTLDDGTELDVEYVTTRDPAGTRVVGVWAEAPRGALADSVAYEVLRTVRVDG